MKVMRYLITNHRSYISFFGILSTIINVFLRKNEKKFGHLIHVVYGLNFSKKIVDLRMIVIKYHIPLKKTLVFYG